MIGEADYEALLGDLYAGVTEPERRLRFLDRLSAASGSHLTAVVCHDNADPAGNRVMGRIEPRLIARYEADYGAPDDKLWFQRAMPAMRTGSVFNGEDWATKSEIRRTRYYADVLREIDTLHSVAICGLMTRTRSAFLTPCRSERQGAYGSTEMALFEQLAPHWVNACRLGSRLEQLQAQAGASDRRQRGLFLLDDDLRWIGGNATAERMVADGWWRGRLGGRLDSPSAVTRAAWQSAQRALASGAAALRPRTIPVYDQLASLVAFASLQPYGAAAAGEPIPSYMLFVRPLHSEIDEDLATQMRVLFELTAAEAALATAMRRHGDLQQAAVELGLTEGSARRRLQAVFEKTAIHRQIDLLRMMDALADTIS